MKADYPCESCVVRACCSNHCSDVIDFYSRFIKAYANSGKDSYFYKAVVKSKVVPYLIRRKITGAIDGFFNIKMASRSGHYVVFNRRGYILERR